MADVPQATLVEPIDDEMYLPLAQRPIQSATRSPMTLVVRTATDAPMFPALRDAVWTLDRQAAVYDGMTLADVLASETWRERLGAHVGAIFAGVALLLAAVGISSVVRYAVTRRWREFGVRLALGATRGHVVTLAVREAAAPVLAGLLAGAILVATHGTAPGFAAGRRRSARPDRHRLGCPVVASRSRCSPRGGPPYTPPASIRRVALRDV